MSRMFTTCPACRLNLAVTAMDLRVGQGYVRCGRCERVFNALVSLSEDIEETEQSGHAATGTTTVPALDEEHAEELTGRLAADADAPEPPGAVTVEPVPIDTPPPAADDELAHWARITPIRHEPVPDVDVVEKQPTGTFETIVLEGDGILQTEEHLEDEELEAQLQQIAQQIGVDSPLEHRQQIELADAAPETADTTDAAQPLEAAPPETDTIDADEAVGNRRAAHRAWGVAAGLLALLLVAQVVHHHRHALVGQALLQGPLQGLYGLFGATLEPAWDLKAYDLRQLGGEALGTSTAIVLRATVHNRAPNRQPPPLIRAVLQDRFGNAIATTAIAPHDYLRGDIPARMAPDQRLDAELRIDDPNRQAVGFELDACLPGRDGALHCSNDP